ncbi:MAG: MBL fold metallo-hydrolase [Dysgonomonas sp.]
MELTYIYHSGFAIEAENYSIVIDFFKDTQGVRKGYVYDHLLKKDTKLYVLSTHSHRDHFSPDILKWKSINPNTQYIFSGDILEDKFAKETDAFYLNKLESYIDKNLEIKAYGSTDKGISFLIKTENKLIFHAGDLNNWHWKDESTPKEIEAAETAYINELNLLAKAVKCLDLAMFPVDQRLGKDYMLGARQFVNKIDVKLFAPMHFGDHYEQADAFKSYAESNGCKFFEIKHRGDSMKF